MSSFKKHKHFDINYQTNLLRNKIYLTRIALFKKYGENTMNDLAVNQYDIHELRDFYEAYKSNFLEYESKNCLKRCFYRVKGFLMTIIYWKSFRRRIAGREV